MKYINLNTKNLIIGKFASQINRFVPHPDKQINGLTWIRDLTPKDSKFKNRVGLYKNNKGEKIVVKLHKYLVPDLDFFHINNEASVLKFLNKENIYPKIYPQFVFLDTKKSQINIAIKYVESQNLSTLSINKKVNLIKEALNYFEEISEKVIRYMDISIPKRSPYALTINFPILMMQLILKRPHLLTTYFKYAILFYLNIFVGLVRGFKIGFIHRDLYPDNIALTKNNKLILFDWENAIITDPIIDLAQIAMIYWKDFGKDRLMNLLREKLENNSQKRRFIAYSIYNSIQALVNTPKRNPHFQNTEEFLVFLLKNIYPKLLRKKSLFEIVYSLILDLIYKFYKLSALSSVSKNKKLILCYHSVGNSGWRFSTHVETFKKQIEFLSKNYKIVPLPKLLKSRISGVCVTFDDGYLDVYENALPLLKKNKIMATMFVLGSPKNVNRDELDNNLPLLSLDEVIKLKKLGWTIGYHTKTHSNLQNMDEEKLHGEIVSGKTQLEKQLGFDVKYFAYPKGFYSEKVFKFIKQAGFTGAFTVDGQSLELRNRMLLDRVPIEGELTINQLEAMLSPVGLFVTNIFMNVLRMKERIQNKVKPLLKELTFSKRYNYAK